MRDVFASVMPPYYSDCVTHYSVNMWQLLGAFGAGFIAAAISNHHSEKHDLVAEPEEMNAAQLREELTRAHGQRDRAFRVIAVLLVSLWICGVFLALHYGIGTGGPSAKTEL